MRTYLYLYYIHVCIDLFLLFTLTSGFVYMVIRFMFGWGTDRDMESTWKNCVIILLGMYNNGYRKLYEYNINFR